MTFLKPEVHNEMVDNFSRLYPVREEIQALLNTTTINAGAIDMTGSAKRIWDSVISYATYNNSNSLEEITRAVLSNFNHNQYLQNLLENINSGSAFVVNSDYRNFVTPTLVGQPVNILLVYDSNDSNEIEGIKQQLKVLELVGSVQLKDINDYQPTGNAYQQQLSFLGASCIVLLLLTPNFFIRPDNNCLQIAYAAKQMGKKFIPILVTNCLYSRIAFLKGLVTLPRNGTFISTNLNRETVEYDTAIEISNYVDHVINKNLC